MCNPSTQHPISEALPLVNALIAEAERNCIDIRNVDIFAHAGGRFTIDLIAYDGGAQALADLLDLHHDVVFTVDGRTFEGVTRTVGRWTIRSHYPLDVEAVAA